MKIRSMQGKTVDFAALTEAQNRVALGNAKMNGRGDLLGKGGVVVATKEELVRDYYQNNPKAVSVSPVALNNITDEVLSPAEAMSRYEEKVSELTKTTKSKRKIVDSDD